MLSYSLRISHSINNWSYITGETKDWDVMKSGRYYVQEKGSICNLTISDREIWITGKEGVEMKKEDRKERYWEETNVAITCTTLKAQLAKYKKIYDGSEGKIFIQKTKKNQNNQKTPECHRKPTGTDCLWCLSTSRELKQQARKQVATTLFPPLNYSLRSAHLSCRTIFHTMLEYYNWIHGLMWKLNKLTEKSIKGH